MPDHSRSDIPSLLKELDNIQPNIAPMQQMQIEQIKGFLKVRTAELVNKQLTATAATVSESANHLKATLENSSEWLINAIKVSTETSTKNAVEIGEQITRLTSALTTASAELQSTGIQSASLGRRLNWLTAVIAFAALISAAATSFYAWETKRQVDLMNQQLQSIQRSPADTNPLPSKG